MQIPIMLLNNQKQEKLKSVSKHKVNDKNEINSKMNSFKKEERKS